MPAERLSERAYRLIKDKIVTLALPPGQVIDERALMQDLGLGRTPVREALLALAREGLVTTLPRCGTLVSDIRLTDLQKIFEVRIVLEGFCARLAAERVTPQQLVQMEALVRELDQAVDTRQIMNIDARFHQLLYEAADNCFIEQTLMSLHALSLRLWYLALERVGDPTEVVAMHEALLEALKTHDGERAEGVIQEHIAEFQQRFRSVL